MAALRQPCRRSCYGQAPDRARAPCTRARVRSQGSARCAVCTVGIRAGALRRRYGCWLCRRCGRGRSAPVRRVGRGVRDQTRRCGCDSRARDACSCRRRRTRSPLGVQPRCGQPLRPSRCSPKHPADRGRGQSPHPQRLWPVHHLQAGGVAAQAGILLKKSTL